MQLICAQTYQYTYRNESSQNHKDKIDFLIIILVAWICALFRMNIFTKMWSIIIDYNLGLDVNMMSLNILSLLSIILMSKQLSFCHN